MDTTKKAHASDLQPHFPSLEKLQQELSRAKSIDDFFGKDGIFARLFADTLEQMLEAELTAHLGYPRHASEGRNSGNRRNGKRTRQLRCRATAIARSNRPCWMRIRPVPTSWRTRSSPFTPKA